MKSVMNVLSLVSLITLTSCGTDSSQTSELSAARATKRPAVIENALATPTSAGINPAFVAYDLTGRIMIGSNRCEAQGVKVKFEEKAIAGFLYVTANTIQPAGAESRICTREFAPQYAEISHKVVYNSKKIAGVFVSHVGELHNHVNISDLTTMEPKVRPAVIEELSAEPTNGGINANHAALLVNAKVMLGSNPCMAGANTAALETRQEGKKLIIRAVTKADPRVATGICPMVFAPVYANVKTVVTYNIMTVKKVVAENFQEMGATVNVFDLVK